MENLLVFLFVNGIFGYAIYCFIFPPKNSVEISDRFEIGYIEDGEEVPKHCKDVPLSIPPPNKDDSHDELKQLKRQLEILKVKKQIEEINRPNKPKSKNNDLFNDCTESLVTLGVTRRKAKAEVEVIFEKTPNIKTIQEFITEYGKR